MLALPSPLALTKKQPCTTCYAGNLINLIVLTRPKLKGVMYRYLLGLAASNLLVLIMAIPALMHISGAIQSQAYPVVFFQAHLEIPLLNSFMASSVYIIICMTVNRYISIYKPTQFQRIHTFKNAYIAIFFSFVGGALLHVPLAFETDVVAKCDEDGKCIYLAQKNTSVESHSLYRVYLWVSEALLRLGPIITLTILNVLIIVRFHKIAMKREVLKGGQQHRGSNASNTPGLAPPSPYYNGGCPAQQSSSSGSGHSHAGANAAGPRGNRLSVTAVNGKLVVPGAIPLHEDHATSVVTTDATSSTFVPAASSVSHAGQPRPSSPSRATSPFPSSSAQQGLQSPSKQLAPAGCGSGSLRLRRGTPTRASSRRRRGLHNPEERMLVVVLIAIVILFVVCTTPAAFLSILVTEELKRRTWFAIFRACANNLELLCFALNFFVYCLCSADIRRAFVDVLFNNVAVAYLRRKSVGSPAAGAFEMQAVNKVAENV